MRNLLSIALLGSAMLGGAPMLVGCDDKTTTGTKVEQKNPDGSKTVDQTKTTTDSNGSKTTTEHKTTP